MKYIKTFESFKAELVSEKRSSDTIDSDLEDIRHYKSSVLQFKQYWDQKIGRDSNPHGTINYKYPSQYKELDRSMPYQDFTNAKSALVKRNLKTRRKSKGKVN